MGTLRGDTNATRLHQNADTETALSAIQATGRGVVLYLWGESLGGQHLVGSPTASESMDERELGLGAQILRDLHLTTLRLLTNSSVHYPALKGYGLQIIERVPLEL
jgi:3,4-dihydroxy 2-butanone 4-phosphate synthase / GTP cyclohydrolase II